MVGPKMDLSTWLRKQLEESDPDLLRGIVQAMVEALMGADADVACNASFGERSPERINSRNGYRPRRFDTRVGTMELAIPKLRAGSYFPRVAARVPPTHRAGVGRGRRRQLPRRGLNPASRQARAPARHRGDV
jgi:hypothetical protein